MYAFLHTYIQAYIHTHMHTLLNCTLTTWAQFSIAMANGSSWWNNGAPQCHSIALWWPSDIQLELYDDSKHCEAQWRIVRMRVVMKWWSPVMSQSSIVMLHYPTIMKTQHSMVMAPGSIRMNYSPRKKEGNVQKVVPFILVLFGRTEACSFWLIDWLDDWIICWLVDFENRILCSLGWSPTHWVAFWT